MRRLAALLLVLAVWGPAVAWAQAPAPAPVNDGTAKPASASARKDREKRAEAAFIGGHYQEAAEILDGLYADFHNPVYLRNLGRCQQRLKNPDKAIAAFDEYLRRGKNITPAERDEVKGFIREMEDLKRQQEAAAAPPPPPPVAPVAAPPPSVAADAPAPHAAVTPPAALAETAPAPAKSHRVGKLLGGGLLIAAALMAGGGGAFMASAYSEQNRALKLGCPNYLYYECVAAKNRVDARSLWSKVLFGAAGLSAIAGGTVLFLSYRRDESTASNQMSVAVEGRF